MKHLHFALVGNTHAERNGLSGVTVLQKIRSRKGRERSFMVVLAPFWCRHIVIKIAFWNVNECFNCAMKVTGIISGFRFSFGNVLTLVFFCHETVEYLNVSS